MRPKQYADEVIIQIYKLYHLGNWKVKELYEAFGVNQSLISEIVSGKRYKNMHLEQYLNGLPKRESKTVIRELVTLICPQCDKEFQIQFCKYKKGQRLCSAACVIATKNKASEDNELTRFWSFVDKEPEEDSYRKRACWKWTGATYESPYGRFKAKVDGVWCKVAAHRYSYELKNGPVPDGLLLRHQCHNPLCVRPDHLLPGTHAENEKDKQTSHRRDEPKIYKRCSYKEIVLARYLRNERGWLVKDIAAHLEIAYQTALYISNNDSNYKRTYTHLTEDDFKRYYRLNSNGDPVDRATNACIRKEPEIAADP
jgi:hypothetical protein